MDSVSFDSFKLLQFWKLGLERFGQKSRKSSTFVCVEGDAAGR